MRARISSLMTEQDLDPKGAAKLIGCGADKVQNYLDGGDVPEALAPELLTALEVARPKTVMAVSPRVTT